MIRAKKTDNKKKESGNVLFLILIAVALFAALSIVITETTRSGSGASNISKEKDSLQNARVQNFLTAVNVGLGKLSFVPCSTVDFSEPGSFGGGDKTCYLFHPEGAAVPYQDVDLQDNDCQGSDVTWTSLSIGQGCSGIIYAGTHGANRLYTTGFDTSFDIYGPDVATGANSLSDGLSNTATLVSSGLYPAANTCRALGAKWYLPSRDEFDVLWANRNTGALTDTFKETNYYVSSSEATASTKYTFLVGSSSWTTAAPAANKNNPGSIRCVRRD